MKYIIGVLCAEVCFQGEQISRMLSKFSKVIQGAGKLKSFIQRNSSTMQAVLDRTAKSRQLPREISLQVLDERHDLNQIRNLLASAFVVNNEPIVHVLGEIYYPALPSKARIPLMEQRFKRLFSKQSILKKVDQGMSFVAVKDGDPRKLVSVGFAEKYAGNIYGESTVDDPLCQTGLNLMRAVHEKAEPIIQEYSLTRDIIFVSHTATHPEYQALGIFQNISDTLISQFTRRNQAIYCVLTSHRLTHFLVQRHGFSIIAEVFYKDYEDNGRKVFEKISEQEISAKALILGH